MKSSFFLLLVTLTFFFFSNSLLILFVPLFKALLLLGGFLLQLSTTVVASSLSPLWPSILIKIDVVCPSFNVLSSWRSNGFSMRSIIELKVVPLEDPRSRRIYFPNPNSIFRCLEEMPSSLIETLFPHITRTIRMMDPGWNLIVSPLHGP